jgi:hypothetical protein
MGIPKSLKSFSQLERIPKISNILKKTARKKGCAYLA